MTKLRPFQIPAEILLVAVTVTAVLAFDRLFIGNDYIRPLLITAFVCHIVASISRRLPGGLATTVLATAVALAVQIGLTYYPESTLLGLPTADTWSLARVDLQDGWQSFQQVAPPAIVEDGFLVAASVGLWLLVVLSDWAAFRLRSPGEALLPGLGVLVFVTFFGRTVASLRDAAFFLAAAIAFFAAHRAGERVASGTWLGGNRTTAYGTLLGWGALLGAVAVAIGVYGGPKLPGSEESAIIDIQEQGEGRRGNRIVVSPFVDIGKRLVEQADVVAFSVRSSQESYYRLTALDTFDGDAWGSNADYRGADGTIENTFPIGLPEEKTNLVQQEFFVEQLGMVWLPAVHQPRQLELPEGVEVKYEPGSSTLIVDEVRQTSDALQYRVVSAIPDYDPEDFQTGATESIDSAYFELPDDFSPRARDLAAEVTLGLTTPYEKALALQNHFRNPSLYSYSLDVPGGQSLSAIDSFLESGIGYCEQFAGTYAAMARSVGLPSRVVVGFTWGIQDPADPDRYVIRGEHAHAWPEVFIAGAGWIAFEPTPGRGAPGNEEYTGVAAAQATSDVPLEDELAEPTPVGPNPAFEDENLSPGLEEFDFGAEETEPVDNETATQFNVGRGTLIILAILGLLMAIIMGIPLLKDLLWRRRAAATGSGRRRIDFAWSRVRALASGLGFGTEPGETTTEFADRVGTRLKLDDDLQRLSEAVTVSTFGPDEPGTADVQEAEALAANVEAELRRRTQTSKLIAYDMDPRPLLRPNRLKTPAPVDAGDPLLLTDD